MLKLAFAFLLVSISTETQLKDNKWVDELVNENNNRCCQDNDGRRLTDPDWDTLGTVKEGRMGWSGYRVYQDNKWYEVPNWAVVNQKNKDGIARVWWDKTHDGTKNVMCFLPGTLG